jgi:hypothetical protein
MLDTIDFGSFGTWQLVRPVIRREGTKPIRDYSGLAATECSGNWSASQDQMRHSARQLSAEASKCIAAGRYVVVM